MSLRQQSEALKSETAHTYAQATARHIRMSPQKVRLVVDLIRGKNLEEARAILKYTPHRASEIVAKVLESAAANGMNDDRKNMIEDQIFIKAAFVDEGPAIKRMLPRARGSANMIKKRTSHITIIVGEKNG
ncbi:50S ribosomal protein L22 [uncultured Meiothermus sp.]|uniref:50S ribosomal protein L22 n=1 Tax=uncultured Meiothermus sp. TaxID=157471 RepID=UPI0026398716|nr:50S ribosomal protein L22 [uncultured Meiothermus sp.]